MGVGRGGRARMVEKAESLRTEREVEQMYARYGGELFGFAMNAVRDRYLAEEIVQETFIRAWRAARRFDPTAGSMRTWLFAIARNSMIDVIRRRPASGRTEPVEELDAASTVDPFDQLLTSIRIEEALQRLSADHRQAVVEVYYHGRTCAELAIDSGIPASTLRSRVYYGVRALRLILQENGGLV